MPSNHRKLEECQAVSLLELSECPMKKPKHRKAVRPAKAWGIENPITKTLYPWAFPDEMMAFTHTMKIEGSSHIVPIVMTHAGRRAVNGHWR